MLAQLIVTKGLLFLALLKWIVPAKKLFPVPVSPVIRMVASVCENFLRVLMIPFMIGLNAIILSKS